MCLYNIKEKVMLKSRNVKLGLCVILCCVVMSMLLSDALAKISGAIYTTFEDGSSVNANIYEAKKDVYLNGGPKSENKTSMALPEGWYYFQVTDPSGKTLLSQDPVICRKFYINDMGVIGSVNTEENCYHRLVVDIYRQQMDAHTLQLIPYKDTPNRGGVYKSWITPVDEFVGDVNRNPKKNRDFIFGFIPSQCKTDNFKVKGKCDPSMLEVLKFDDINSNGVWDEEEPAIDGWGFKVTDPSGSSNDYETPANLFLTKGIWQVQEYGDPNWMQTTLYIDGVASEPAKASAAISVSKDCDEKREVIFGNTRIYDIKVDKFHDKNINGVKDLGEDWSEELPEITIRLSGHTLGGVEVNKAMPAGADGRVVFKNVVAGVYTVCEEGAPADWVAITPECVDVTLPKDADANHKVSIGFANVQKCRISLCKFYDLNSDGVFQEGENWTTEQPKIKFCLSGKTVAGDEVEEICKMTDENGCIVFEGLLPGKYEVCEKDIPENWKCTTGDSVSADVSSGDKLELGHVIGNVDFCDISVSKFYDANENGTNDNEPLLGGFRFVLMKLTDTTLTVIAEKCTDENGSIVFEKLYAGSYMLYENLSVNENQLGIHWKQTTNPPVIVFNLPNDCDRMFEFGCVCSETSLHDFGTKGYWHNKNGLAELKSDAELYAKVLNYLNSLAPYKQASDYFAGGDEPFDGKFKDGSDVSAGNIDGALAGTVEAEISHFLTESVGDGGTREQLAQQMLAFIFNVHYKAGSIDAKISLPGKPEVKASDLIAEAVAAWSSASKEDQAAVSSRLDAYNNSDSVLSVVVSDVPCNRQPCSEGS
jgi:hypothetical protein